MIVPYVDGKGGDHSKDLFSRLMEDRVVFLVGEVREDMANLIVAQLLYLESKDPKKDITLYINSPGGSVTAGMAIYDTMQFIKPDVATVCAGMACSMGSLLLSGGAKGKRMCLPHAEVMIHQPLGGARGQATDIEITAKNILKWKRILTGILASNSGQDYDKVAADCERDYFMDAQETLAYGLIDKIVEKRQ